MSFNAYFGNSDYAKSKKSKKKAPKKKAPAPSAKKSNYSSKPYNRFKNYYYGGLQIYKDVQLLKNMINAEKKRINISYLTNLAVGQVIGNGNGFYAVDVTPTPASGTNVDQRSGASIKLSASHFTFMIQQDTATVNKVKLHCYLYQIKGVPYSSASTFVTDHWQANTFISGASIVDYNSDMDPDHYNNAKLLKQWTMTLPNDQVSQTTIKQYKTGIKYNGGQGHHIRFENNATTVVQG